MLQRTGEAETITTHYLAALGAYRALYIPNWIYRYVWGRPRRAVSILVNFLPFISGGTRTTLLTSSLSSLALSNRGCTPISSTSTSPSELFSSGPGFTFLHRYTGCCKERSSNYPRESISAYSNRWYKMKLSYFYLRSSCKDLVGRWADQSDKRLGFRRINIECASHRVCRVWPL